MTQNRAANMMAALTVLCSVFCMKSAQWGAFCYAIFLPFFLVEWLYFKRRPSFAMSHWAGWGMVIFAIALLIATLLGGGAEDFQKMIGYLKYTIPFFMMLYLGNTFSIKKGLEIGILAAMTVLCFYGFYEWIAGSNRIMVSVYHQHNTFAMVLEILIPAGALIAMKDNKKEIRWLSGFLTILCLLCLLLSDSRGGILGLAGGIVLTILTLVFLNGKGSVKKVLFALALCAVVAGAGTFMTIHINQVRGSDTGGERVMMLESSYHMWKDHKLSGVGLAQWKKNYYGSYRPEGQQEEGLNMPHNMFMLFLSTTGVIGLVGYFVYLLFTYKALLSGLKFSQDIMLVAGLIVFLAIFCHGFVDGTLNSEKVARFYFAVMGYAMALTSLNHKKVNRKVNSREKGMPC